MVSQQIGKPFALHHIDRTLRRRVIPDRCLKACAQSLRTGEVLNRTNTYTHTQNPPSFHTPPMAQPTASLTSQGVPGVKTKKSPTASSDSRHLFEAVTKGKIHLTRFILAAASGQLANSWDEDGRTPLIACCDIKEEGTRDQIVQILLEGGADVNMMDSEGRSPLIHACEKRCNDIVRLLIHHHKIKPDLEDEYGNTALIYSAAVGNDVATELLTKNFRRLGLQVDHYNKQGNTALLLATQNGNLHCAKILAQKGKASVNLKDKEHGLTPMEWCLKKGFDKDDVDFLKPNTRFYRVAKLATSLSRSRSSVASITLDAKSKVSPSKAVDGSGSSKGRAKITLSRSKSQAAEMKPPGKGGTVSRQSTMDFLTGNHRHPAPNKHPDGKAADVMNVKDVEKNRTEDKNGSGSLKKDGIRINSNPRHETTDTCATTADERVEREDGVKETVVKNDKKHAPGNVSPSATTDVSNDRSKSGQITGLGFPLNTTSMVSSSISLGSSGSSSRPSSGLENASLSTNITYLNDSVNDHDSNVIRHAHALAPVLDDVSVPDASFGLDDVTQSSFSSTPNTKEVRNESQCEQAPTVNASDDIHKASLQGSADDRTSTRVCIKRNPSLRDAVDPSSAVELEDCGETSASQTDVGVTCSATRDAGPMPPSLDRLQKHQEAEEEEEEEEGEESVDAEDRYVKAGHRILTLVTGSNSSVTEYDLQGSPNGQDSRIVSHVCGAHQISQDV